MANPLLGLVPHPLAVMAHVFGEPLRALAIPRRAPTELCPRFRVDRGETGEARRELYQRLGDQHRDRVQVRAAGVKSQPLRLQRYRASAAERIDHWRRLLNEKGIDLGFALWRWTPQPSRN